MSNLPIISILHPTARVKPGGSFPRGFLAAHDQFLSACVNPLNVEYVLIVHESRWEDFWRVNGAAVPFIPKAPFVKVAYSSGVGWGSLVVVKNSGRDCVVDQINAGAAVCSGQLLIGIMDDLEAPEAWDRAIAKLLPDGTHCGLIGRDFDGEHVLDLTGEANAQHIIYGALTRARYEKQGFILHPEFESMYADNYFSWAAHRDAVVIDGRHLGFKHHHFTSGENTVDAVYAQQNRADAYEQGKATFAKLTTGKQTLAIVMPGESFPAQYVANAFDLMGNLLADYNVQPHFGFSSVVHATRYDLHNELIDATPKPDLAFFMDDDNICTYAHVERLLRDLQEHPELDGVVGWCWCDNRRAAATKADEWTMSVGKLSAADDFGGHQGLRFNAEDFAGGPIISARDIQARYGDSFGFWTGFPCVLLRYETLVKMGRDCFAPILHPKAHRGFTGEDAAFCWNARRLGVNLAVDLRVKVPHLKLGAFEPDFDYRESAVKAVKLQEAFHG